VSTQMVVTVEQFSRDLWEVTREDLRAQLGDAVLGLDFDAEVPPWDHLPEATRREKVRFTREELLRVIDRAGYEVRRKP
jgi:hypothetical protein